jgi:hypothetical protein
MANKWQTPGKNVANKWLIEHQIGGNAASKSRQGSIKLAETNP